MELISFLVINSSIVSLIVWLLRFSIQSPNTSNSSVVPIVLLANSNPLTNGFERIDFWARVIPPIVQGVKLSVDLMTYGWNIYEPWRIVAVILEDIALTILTNGL